MTEAPIIDQIYEMYISIMAAEMGYDISTPELRQTFIVALALDEILTKKQ